MAFVLDASVTLAWVMQDESDPLADLAFAKIRFEYATVPAIWWYEVRNMLVVNGRRGRITEADSDRALFDLSRMRTRVGSVGDHGNLLDLARKFKLSVYDAVYLDLALRQQTALATLDKELRAAAQLAGVALLSPP